MTTAHEVSREHLQQRVAVRLSARHAQRHPDSPGRPPPLRVHQVHQVALAVAASLAVRQNIARRQLEELLASPDVAEAPYSELYVGLDLGNALNGVEPDVGQVRKPHVERHHRPLHTLLKTNGIFGSTSVFATAVLQVVVSIDLNRGQGGGGGIVVSELPQ